MNVSPDFLAFNEIKLIWRRFLSGLILDSSTSVLQLSDCWWDSFSSCLAKPVKVFHRATKWGPCRTFSFLSRHVRKMEFLSTMPGLPRCDIGQALHDSNAKHGPDTTHVHYGTSVKMWPCVHTMTEREMRNQIILGFITIKPRKSRLLSRRSTFVRWHYGFRTSCSVEPISNIKADIAREPPPAKRLSLLLPYDNKSKWNSGLPAH